MPPGCSGKLTVQRCANPENGLKCCTQATTSTEPTERKPGRAKDFPPPKKVGERGGHPAWWGGRVTEFLPGSPRSWVPLFSEGKRRCPDTLGPGRSRSRGGRQLALSSQRPELCRGSSPRRAAPSPGLAGAPLTRSFVFSIRPSWAGDASDRPRSPPPARPFGSAPSPSRGAGPGWRKETAQPPTSAREPGEREKKTVHSKPQNINNISITGPRLRRTAPLQGASSLAAPLFGSSSLAGRHWRRRL